MLFKIALKTCRIYNFPIRFFQDKLFLGFRVCYILAAVTRHHSF